MQLKMPSIYDSLCCILLVSSVFFSSLFRVSGGRPLYDYACFYHRQLCYAAVTTWCIAEYRQAAVCRGQIMSTIITMKGWCLSSGSGSVIVVEWSSLMINAQIALNSGHFCWFKCNARHTNVLIFVLET